MSDNTWCAERRREERYEAAGRVSWTSGRDRREHTGWLSDRSRSSISFITAASSQPSYGEDIEVCQAGRQGSSRRVRRQRWRVARVAPYDDQLSLVACTTIRPDQS